MQQIVIESAGLADEQMEWLKREAVRRGVPVSQLALEALEEKAAAIRASRSISAETVKVGGGKR